MRTIKLIWLVAIAILFAKPYLVRGGEPVGSIIHVPPNVAIFSSEAARAERRKLSTQITDFWDVSTGVAANAVEAILKSNYTTDFSAESRVVAPMILSRISASKLQIAGVYLGARKVVFVRGCPGLTFLKKEAHEEWLRELVLVRDGGPDYWWVYIDAETFQILECGVG